jgi:hypothetical protein
MNMTELTRQTSFDFAEKPSYWLLFQRMCSPKFETELGRLFIARSTELFGLAMCPIKELN